MTTRPRLVPWALQPVAMATALAGCLGVSTMIADDEPAPSTPTAAVEESGGLRDRAERLARAGRHAEAAEAWSAILTREPGEASAMAGRVRALIASDAWREALDEAVRFAAERPDAAEVASALGEAHYRAGRIEKAGSILEPLAESDRPPVRALVGLASVRAAQGREAEAAALLERALEAAPEDRWVLYNAAWAAETRAEAVARLERYLTVGEGDDPDRLEGARGTIRLYAALGERPIWVAKSRPERLEIPMRPLLGPGGSAAGWIVEARVGKKKKKLPLLLDTGSGGLFVVARAVEKAEFEPLAEETVFAGGGEGRTRSRRGLLPSFVLGDLVIRDALVTTTTQDLEPSGRYLGVLGLSVFQGYSVTLDLDRGRLTLEPPLEDPPGEPYWSVSGQMLVEASAGNGAKGLFLFDTGASRSLLATSFVEALPDAVIGADTRVSTYGGPVAGARVARGVALRFAGVASDLAPKNAADITQRSRLGGVEISGYLGLDVLDDAIIAVDTKARRVDVREARGVR